jgi:hypothetical protein
VETGTDAPTELKVLRWRCGLGSHRFPWKPETCERFESAVELAEQAFATELQRLTGHLAERLTGLHDGQPTPGPAMSSQIWTVSGGLIWGPVDVTCPP